MQILYRINLPAGKKKFFFSVRRNASLPLFPFFPALDLSSCNMRKMECRRERGGGGRDLSRFFLCVLAKTNTGAGNANAE